MRIALIASALLGCSACAQALKEPSPIAAYAPGRAQGRSASELVTAANAAWARRGDPGSAERAQGLYLDAAVADEQRVDALLGAMRALAFRIEYERGAPRGELAETAVAIGQWCRRRAPTEPECDYRLAIALGQQARERPSTGTDAMRHMVELLERAIATAPGIDAAGPHRVLALLLLRAPPWPVGPGDPETALDHARAAVSLAPRAAANQLVLGEALVASGRSAEARAAYTMAIELASAAAKTGDPDAARHLAQARSGLAKTRG